MRKTYFILFLLFIIMPEITYAIDSKLVITCDQNISDKWQYTFSENIPNFNVVEHVFKKQYFSILLFLTDFKTNEDKIANVKYDLVINKPDGGNYFEKKGIEGLSQKVNNPDYVQLSNANLAVCFESEDKPGIYQIIIETHDLISNKTTTTHSKIILADFKNENHFLDDQAFNDWLTHYYLKPSPEKAIDAYFYYSKSKLSENKNGFIPVFSFFRELFNNNCFLIKHVQDLYSAQDLNTRIHIIYLLRHLNYDSSKFLNALEGKEKEVYKKMISETFPLVQDEITTASHLDIQWSVFLATGKIEPIRRIISAFMLSKYSGSLEKFDNTSKTDLDKQNAVKDSVFQAACWSLASNCKQYPLVGQYCSYLFGEGDLNENERLWTGMILAKVYPDKFVINEDETGVVTIKMF